MCGIVGYCGYRPASVVLLEGLKRLEYRGYDSAGICVGTGNKFELLKKRGKIRELNELVGKRTLGDFGIGHTRWATHGEANDRNAHPHTSASGDVVLVHNGIIENYAELKKEFESSGQIFQSETDTEVIAFMIEDAYKGNLENAVREVLPLLKGTYGIAVIHKNEPGKIVGARNGSPLVLGIGEHEMFLASDVTAILAYTKDAVYLNDGELVSITKDGYRTFDINDTIIQKQVEQISWELEQIEKRGFKHFMQKEIHEQVESISRAFQGRLNKESATGHLGGLNMLPNELLGVRRVIIMAAGTSYHAGMIGAYLIEKLARIPASAELSSEIRYKNPVVEHDSLYFVVSQSGETADTLQAMREIQRKGGKVLGLCNVVGSTIARESDGGVYLHSGPEIAVASTKAFTSQLAVLYVLALSLARMRHLSIEDGLKIINALEVLPEKISSILKQTAHIEALAEKYHRYENFLFLGRGMNYPVAMEGALKLKEISYIHAEGYSAAEIKHGPIALINENTPSFFLVPDDLLRDKVITNMKEVKARKGKLIAVAVEGDLEIAGIADDVIYIPHTEEIMYPFLMVLPTQLFAYYCAIKLGRDVDQPRNLAKSVTVE
ncbi:MAG: glutamine--fructose-6-phosphate transaminase (isomerizing) [Spirochaetes bacterium]|nr:glutamine--fructose-6-phosphate transaminase (isomerizing) [Spirochaetota bacterium]MBL7006901.1 glutamine--fructose-6-phosphate transaminase (isomerizing) [Spirochaetia bacterium]